MMDLHPIFRNALFALLSLVVLAFSVPGVFADSLSFEAGLTINTGLQHSFVTGSAVDLANNEIPLDLNDNNTLDLVTANPNDNSISILLDVDGATFAEQRTISVGTAPRAVAAGDLNNDTYIDLLVRNQDSFSLLWNNGDATFLAPVTISNPELAGIAPASVTLGDFNFDGYLDIVAMYGTFGISSLVNNSGTFSQDWNNALVAFVIPQEAIIAFHADNDGKLDVVITNYVAPTFPITESVVIFRNTTSVSGEIISFTTTVEDAYQFNTVATGVAVADINSDTLPDILPLKNSTQQVIPLENDGDGTFTQQSALETDATSTLMTISKGDLNLDNKVDLITANQDSNNVSVLLSNGDGTFQTSLAFSLGASPTNLTISDVDDDGDLDILTTNSGMGLTLLTNTLNPVSSSSSSNSSSSSSSSSSSVESSSSSSSLSSSSESSESSTESSTSSSSSENADSDNDGMSDEEEILLGSDPNDPGSIPNVLRSPTYALWNGFLDMTCILELVNNGTEGLTATVSLFQIDGALGSKVEIPLAPQEEFDVILNDMVGFQKNSYGLVKIEYTGLIDGRVFFYRLATEGNHYDFAFGVPLANPNYGQSAIGFNTFQPSLALEEQSNPVANWLSVVNPTDQTKGFTITKYSQEGGLLSSLHLILPAFGRMDLDGGHVIPGPMHVGVNIIEPDDESSPYLAQLVRYGHDAPPGTPNVGYNFAFPLMARVGNGQAMHMPIANSFSAQNWVEVVNTLNQPVAVSVRFHNADGFLLNTADVSLAAFSQEHFDASALLLPTERGIVTVEPSVPNSIIAQSMYYFRDTNDGKMLAMYGSQAREAFGSLLFGTYNLFLDMLNTLRLSNPSGYVVSVDVTINNIVPPTELTVDVPAYGSVDLELHDNGLYGTEVDTYGVVGISTLGSGEIIAEIIRTRLIPGTTEVDFRAPTEVR